MRADLQAGAERAEDLDPVRAAGELSHRAHLPEVNHTYAERLLALQREWLEEAEHGAQRRTLALVATAVLNRYRAPRASRRLSVQ